MKRLLILSVSILGMILGFAASASTLFTQEETEIDLEKITKVEGPGKMGFPRSVYYLEAYYNDSNHTLKLILGSLGNTYVYIKDVDGNVICQLDIVSDDYLVEHITLPPIDDSLMILVDSDVVYAYGTIM